MQTQWAASDLFSAPRQVVPLWQMAILIVDAIDRLDIGSEQNLAHHLRNHDHADVLSEAFVAAEAEVEIVIPVAPRYELVRVLEGLWIEHRRLG